MAPNYDDDDDDDDDDEVDEDEEEEEEGDEEGEEEEEEEQAAPVAKKKRSKGKNKDPLKPKRNMSAFFLYSQAYRSQVKQDNPDAQFGDVVSHYEIFTSCCCVFDCCVVSSDGDLVFGKCGGIVIILCAPLWLARKCETVRDTLSWW